MAFRVSGVPSCFKPRSPGQSYVVKAKDTLGKIAKQLYGSESQFPLIVAANRISNPDRLQVGQRLNIPTPARPLPPSWLLHRSLPGPTGKRSFRCKSMGSINLALIAPGPCLQITTRHLRGRTSLVYLDLFHFVKASNVDPIYFERSYYVAPESGAEKAYALLLEAMRKKECLGIGRIRMHRREHMLILRPSEGYLVAHTMFYANEVRPAPQVELTTEFSNKELSVATGEVCELNPGTPPHRGTPGPEGFLSRRLMES